ncbi:MAG: hypothetical protein HYV06_07030 [Deltaproteobacteria bacterium]|nr:hypothetical protein [Deltaproteobacteria bacterium]
MSEFEQVLYVYVQGAGDIHLFKVGIFTTKPHSFGPMGLEDLTITKFIIYVDVQVRE